jgi:hypothetical protein
VKTVLDEGVPADIVPPLRKLGADIEPFRSEWRGLTNGLLLSAVEQAGFSLLLTNDKNMGFQLNLRRLRLAIVALPINRPDILLARQTDILDTLRSAQRGQFISIGFDGRRIVRSADAAGAVKTDELPQLPPFNPYWRH